VHQGSLGVLLEAIEPAIAEARREPGPLLDNAVRANVRLGVSQLRSAKGVEVVGAVYDLATGVVELL
jgi:hypothetical protein